MQHEGNGDSHTDATKLARWEAALESERRQREQLERRLQDAERRLESALAAVGGGSTPDTALLQLKSQLAEEMEAAQGRAFLEHQLLELEFQVNAREEGESPAKVRYVPAPRTIPVPPDFAPAQAKAAPAQALPRDFDQKLAAAQMAIDAAEARATHNAFQVRKLTEELAFARAEQIRLASEMRSLRERIDLGGIAPVYSSAATLLPPAAPEEVEDLVAPWEAPATPAAIETKQEPERDALSLEDALGSFGDTAAADEAIQLEDALAAFSEAAPAHEAAAAEHDLEEALAAFSEAAPVEEVDADTGLEDALASFGEAQTTSTADEGAGLEDALAAFGEAESARPVIDAPELGDSLEDALSSFGEEAEQDPEAFAAGVTTEHHPSPEEDEIVAALEAWGETGGGCNTEVNLPKEPSIPLDEPVTQDWGSLLEVDTLNRLDTPDAPVEQRVAEALRSDALSHEGEAGERGLLEDIESAPMEEEEHRWEPVPTPAEEYVEDMVGAGLDAGERIMNEDAGPRDEPETESAPDIDPEPEPVPDDFESPGIITTEPSGVDVNDEAAEVTAERWEPEQDDEPHSIDSPEEEPLAPYPPDMDTPGEFPEDPAEDDREIPADELRPAAALHEIAAAVEEEEAAEEAAAEIEIAPTVSQGATLDALESARQTREERERDERQRGGRKLGKKHKSSRNQKPVTPVEPKRNVGPVVLPEIKAAPSRPAPPRELPRVHEFRPASRPAAAEAPTPRHAPPRELPRVQEFRPAPLPVASEAPEEVAQHQAPEPLRTVEPVAIAPETPEAAPVVVQPPVPVHAQEPGDDFEPDLTGLMQRGAAARQGAAGDRGRGSNREAMINALQRFIGE